MRPLLLVLLFALWTSPTFAADYYLKGDCPFNGNGRAAECAGARGGAGAFNLESSFQTALASCAAGDVFYVRAKSDGTPHVFDGNSDHQLWHGGLRVGCSGTPANPVVITNHPGEVGFLAHCTNAQRTHAACDNATISTSEHNYVRIGSPDGLYNPASHLKVRGVITVHGVSAANRAQGNVVQGIECVEGWEYSGDGNWACIRLEFNDKAVVRRNHLHDLIVLPGGGVQGSASCIKLYTSLDTIVEFNRCETVNVPLNQAGGIDDKADSVRNIHRFNFITGVPTCIRVQNQHAIQNSTGTKIYGNICVGSGASGEAAIDLLEGSIDDIDIYNNTLVGFDIGLQCRGAMPGTGAIRFWNNILADIAMLNVDDDSNDCAIADLGTFDYNAYDNRAGWLLDGRHDSLGAWRRATSKDAGSHEQPCGGFAKGADTNYHISGTRCDNEGRAGGVSPGMPVQQGAYGVTTCVGLCPAASTDRR